MTRPADAIISYDTDGVVTGWNAAAQTMLGYAAQEVMGSFVTRLVPPESQHAAEQLRRRAAGGEPVTGVRTVRIGRDGLAVPVLASIVALSAADGSVIGFCEIVGPAEVTAPAATPMVDRRRRHDNYLEAELYRRVQDDPAIFDFLQDGSLDGVWYWDLEDPTQEWMSPRLKHLFGYTDDEVPNTSAWWQAAIFPDDRDLALENFRRHCTDPDYPYDQIVRYRHKDGSTVWVRCRGLVIRDATGTPRRMLGCHTDLTAIKNAEKQLTDRAAELELANRDLADAGRLKADVMAMLSHEINQPLCVMRNYSGLLATRWASLAEQQRLAWVRSLDDSARELSRLIADLLLMFRLDSSAMTASRSALDARTAVVAAVSALAGDAEIEVVADDHLPVLADRGQLNQMLINLITNATKYGEPPIQVSTTLTGNSVRVEVRDHGPGVLPEFVPLLFSRFTRASGAAGLGAGLGLYIVDQLATANGARIRYEQAEPTGARFVLELQLATPARSRTAMLAGAAGMPAAEPVAIPATRRSADSGVMSPER
jgi:hypothetical protein